MLTVVLDVVDVWKGNRGITALRSIDKIRKFVRIPPFWIRLAGSCV
jgi:hypothetical protein